MNLPTLTHKALKAWDKAKPYLILICDYTRICSMHPRFLQGLVVGLVVATILDILAR